MAFSATKVSTSISGNVKQEIWSFNSAGVTSGSFTVGMGVVQHVQVNDETTAGGKASKSGSTVSLSGLTSNDVGTVLVIGY